MSDDYLKFAESRVEPEHPCEFCGEKKEGVMTFYIGEWDNQTVLGRVCVKCLWKGISKVLSSEQKIIDDGSILIVTEDGEVIKTRNTLSEKEITEESK